MENPDTQNPDPPEPDPDTNLAEAIRRRFAPCGGVDLPEFPDSPAPEPPSFD